jgi:antitoxin (DNA-binding transcriptional repressor) of toxin-antitoxin stability system
MTETLTVTEVARHFADYVNRVAYRRAAVVLFRGRKPVAELRPLPAGKRLAELPGLLAALPRLDDGGEFAAELDAARRELARPEVVDPWQS